MLMDRVMDEGEQLTPRYTDVFAATNFEINERSSVAARLLFSDDDLRLVTTDGTDDVDSAGTGRSAHLWLTFDHAWTDALQMNTVLSVATVNQQRDSFGEDEHRVGTVYADNDFRFLDLKQDWSWQVGDRHLPRWGFNVNRQEGDYDYALLGSIFDPLITPTPIAIDYGTNMDVKVNKLGVYGSWRTRLTDALTAEAGARWDSYEYPDDLKFDVVSPRFNLVYEFGGANELRAAWGVVYQPQAANELQVEDNVTEFFEPERSEQFVIGYARHFSRGCHCAWMSTTRTTAICAPVSRTCSIRSSSFPKAASDRIRIDAPEARARGVELTLRREAERGLSGWVSLSFAEAQENVQGDWQSRSWEQEQTLAFGSSWTGAKWNVSLAGLFHSGTPTTYIGIETMPLPGGGMDVQGVVGPRNEEHFAAYTRLDLRANRDVQLRNSKLSFYLEVTNLLNSQNECCINDYHLEPGRNNSVVLVTDPGYWLPMLPSFGFQWEF